MESSWDRLHPWPVISSVLFECPQNMIPTIVESAGLTVDWEVPADKEYGAAIERRWRPEINRAIRRLPEGQQLMAAQVVARGIAEHRGLDQLTPKLSAIGWNLEGNTLVAVDIAIHERFLPRGSVHEAYVELREFVANATASVMIIDPYVDKTLFALLQSAARPGMTIKILTKDLPSDFVHETRLFTDQQQSSVEIRISRDFHDRFIIIDQSRCLHLGHSIKDAGKRACFVSEVLTNATKVVLIAEVERSWGAGTGVT